MPATDAERLRAAGHTVQLADGEYPLVYDFAALLQLEKAFGGLAGIAGVIKRWQSSGDEYEFNLADLQPFLVCGLAHVPLASDAVVRGFLLSQTNQYQMAILLAIDEAFPTPSQDGQGNGQSEVVKPSNGTSSTTSPLSDTASLTPTSGG